MSHLPAMREAALAGLVTDRGGFYIDATFGAGGHTEAILANLDDEGCLIAMDRDPQTQRWARRFARDRRFRFVHASFGRLKEVALSHGLHGAVCGVIFDVGVSSMQLDDPQRGFSFHRKGPLDMRMDTSSDGNAREWLVKNDEKTIADVLHKYGEERRSRKLAYVIKQELARNRLHTTAELAQLVSRYVHMERGKHPATRTFQALRIAVNDELSCLRSALRQALALLRIAGRIVVITFHSLEHRIVKCFAREYSGGKSETIRGLPLAKKSACLRVVRKCTPSEEEAGTNPRVRSARMLVMEKLAQPLTPSIAPNAP